MYIIRCTCAMVFVLSIVSFTDAAFSQDVRGNPIRPVKGVRAPPVMEDPVQMAKTTVQKAEVLMQDGKWDQAQSLLEARLQKCESFPGAGANVDERKKEARAILNFCLGYAHQMRAESLTATRRKERQRRHYYRIAAAVYQQVLRDYPENVHALNNLGIVSLKLDQWDRANSLFRKVEKIDPERSYSYRIALGDYFRDKNEQAKAQDYYKKAVRLNYGKDTAHRRLMRSYVQANSLQDLLDHALELQDNEKPQLAKEGFEGVMERGCNTNEELAEKALVGWVRLGARQGWISKEYLSDLPGRTSWNTEPLRQLHLLIEKPLRDPTDYAWWSKGEHIPAQVMKALADRKLIREGREGVRKSAAMYERAWNTICPEGREDLVKYEGNPPPVTFELAKEMITLYHNFPDLNPDNEKLKRLVIDTDGFAHKFKKGNADSLRDYHATLGIVLAKNGKWIGENRAEGAEYHLEQALKVPEEKKSPYLQGILAEGYVKKGEIGQALKTYMAAAEGYLNRDDLENAGRIVERCMKEASKARGPVEEESGSEKSEKIDQNLEMFQEKADRLDVIIKKRKELAKQPGEVIAWNNREYLKKGKEIDQILASVRSSEERTFLEHQRFKIYCDLGKRAAELKKPEVEQYLYTCALGSVENLKTVSGFSDIARLERIDRRVSSLIKVDGPGKKRALDVVLPGEKKALQVSIGEDVLLAGKIARKMQEESGIGLPDKSIIIKNGKAEISKDKVTPETYEKAKSLLKQFEGNNKLKRIQPKKN